MKRTSLITAAVCVAALGGAVPAAATVPAVTEPTVTISGCTIYAVGSTPVFGTNGNDVICGDDDDNIIYALGGTDVVLGFGGDDLIFLGDNGAGSSLFYGGRVELPDGGSTTSISAGEREVAYGGAGDDRIYGGNGDDHLNGGNGDDQLWGQNGDDHLEGGGEYVVRGFLLFDRLMPPNPDLEISGSDRLIGGNGVDGCVGGPVVQTCEIS